MCKRSFVHDGDGNRVKTTVGSSTTTYYVGDYYEMQPVPEIFLEPRDYSSVGSDLLKFDIWSNIHYGYVGRALGFSQWKLTAGAGVEQIGSDKRWGVSSHFSPGADNWFASWGHPSDNAAI